MTSTKEAILPPSETAQSLHTNEHPVPKGAVFIGVLKSVEKELTRRGMLGSEGYAVTPLWFLAETERNIFLWRSGRSIDDQRDYDFWVDVPALIKKRRAQLDKPHGLNPFINPLWGGAPLDEGLVDGEVRYMDEFEELLSVILPHAAALSLASREVRHELQPGVAQRTTVLLPAFKKTRQNH
jgi:hypothetical protein